MTPDVASLFLERARYYLLAEYRTKLRSAVGALPAGALWWRPNDESNSAGNLLLHLEGNVRQWLVDGVQDRPSRRRRAGEFSARDGETAEALLARLDDTLGEADRALGRLSARDLLERRTIQGRDVTVLEAIFHVVEHFSHHLGQVILLAKHHAPGTVRFYEDADGLARPLWPDRTGGSS
jgi:uncharacterized damage-inducible protein DinB